MDVPRALLQEMLVRLPPDQAAEMAIPSYLHRNPVMRWMATRRLDVLADWAAQYGERDGSVLDFGCGTGILFPALRPFFGTLYGVDLNLQPAAMLVERLGIAEVRLLLPDALESEIADDSLSVVVCGEVLEHIADLPPLLRRLRRKLKPEGHLLVTAPTENRLYRLGRSLAGFSGEYHVGHAAAIHQQILEAGFLLRRRKYIPLPGALAIYWAMDYALRA
ncbi:MAG: SAM-dependent methyltransferase [Anaerolineae bacterium]|nr:MAG: SAM-dependent methyltransferase [Anaerolineae bacterium]